MLRRLILAAAATAALAVGSGEAQAVVEEPVIDAEAPPPPIPDDLTPAGETAPPADAIGDPITPDATCGDWYRQGSYGGVWSTDSTWWEYRCRYEDPQCNPVCNANFVPSIWDDYFYWDGSRAVFYGEHWGNYYLASLGMGDACDLDYWWDAPTSQWYWPFESPENPFGGAACPAPPPDNAAPTAAFTSSCSGLTCTFDASGSADGDGTVDWYRWEFGDGTSGYGKNARHTYAQGGSFTVVLTVVDNWGATGTESKVVSPIGLTAHGYKVKGLQKVDLSWTGSSAASFDVYRDGAPIAKNVAATVPTTEYTDNIDRKGSGSYRYRVCEAGGTSTCSNEVTVTF